MINRQLSKQGIRWPVSPDHTAGVSVHPSKSSIFWSYPLTNYQFQMIAGSSLFFPRIHIKYVVFMSLWPRTIRILISNWPRTRKFSQFFKNTGGEDLFLPWSRVGHALRPIFMLWLVKIWQVSSCGKFMQHLEFCLLWQPKLTFMASLFIRFLVEKYVACQSRKSDFGWHRFRFSPCLMRKRV